MKTFHRSPRVHGPAQFIETLEDRRLFSTVLLAGTTGAAPTIATVAPISSAVVVSGTNIHAEVNQPFTAVIGNVRGLIRTPIGYTLQGSIDWGDGSAASAAKFVRQADGSIAVEGSHDYGAVGSDNITVTITEAPPPGSAAAIILVGTIHSKADVIGQNGGVTVEETAGTQFTAALGIFSSRLPLQNLTAVILWGDGQLSLGKILALPTADPVGGKFEVVGDHFYGQTGSYPVTVLVVNLSPVASTAAATPLVATINSVIDVLPLSPLAT